MCPLCRSKIEPGNGLKPAHRAICAVVDSLMVYCPTCRRECARSALSDHVSKCPVDCSRQCGAKVPPCDRVKHGAICPLVRVACSAADVGCEVHVARVQLSEHESHCEFKRNHLVLKRIAALEVNAEKDASQIARLVHENLEMKQQLAELKPIQKDMVKFTLRLGRKLTDLCNRLKEKEDALAGLDKRLLEEARLAWPRFQAKEEESTARFCAVYFTGKGLGASLSEAQKVDLIAYHTAKAQRDVPDSVKVHELLEFADGNNPDRYSVEKGSLTDDQVLSRRICSTFYRPLQSLLKAIHGLKCDIAQVQCDEPPVEETIQARYPQGGY